MQIEKFQKMKDNRYKVFLKNGESLILYDDTIIKFNLLISKKIDNLEEVTNYNNELLSYYKALKRLAVKMRSKKEVRDYLKRLDFSTSLIEKTISKLEKDGYINEEKYVKAYILDQLNLTLNGPQKIIKSLKKLEIDEDLIFNELNNIDEEVWINRAQKIINKRLKVNKDSKNMFTIKTSQYLNTLGYTKDIYCGEISMTEINDQDNLKKDAYAIYKKLSKKYQNEKLYFNLKTKLYIKGYDKYKIDDIVEEIKNKD